MIVLFAAVGPLVGLAVLSSSRASGKVNGRGDAIFLAFGGTLIGYAALALLVFFVAFLVDAFRAG